MATREWQPNAFFHSDDREEAEAILVITDDEGREISQVLTVRKFNTAGEINPDWTELLEQVPEETIAENTKERIDRKAKEQEYDVQREKASLQARELEHLFDSKIKVLEIDKIKNTTNKKLKTKLRRSKNLVELNMYAQLILMEVEGLGFVTYDEEK